MTLTLMKVSVSVNCKVSKKDFNLALMKWTKKKSVSQSVSLVMWCGDVHYHFLKDDVIAASELVH